MNEIATAEARPSRSRMTRADVRERLRRDRERLRAHYATHGLPEPSILALHPSYMCLWLHRWSAYHFSHDRRLWARLLWHLNLVITGADLGLSSDIGPGLVIIHPLSTLVFGRIGANCTIWGHAGMGGGLSRADIGAGPGLPIVGDGVTFGARSIVLGPVRVGDDCILEPGVIVTRDVPSGSTVSLEQPRRSPRIDAV
jgi:serine O-acetyltransferase